MKYRISSSLLIAVVLALIAIPSVLVSAQERHGADRVDQVDRDRNFDRDRGQDRDRDRGQDRDRDRAFDRDRLTMRGQPRDWDRLGFRDLSGMKDQDIYGYDYMTAEERENYRDQLRSINSLDDRQKFQAKHEERMQERALKSGGDLVPPGQGSVYGGEFMTVQERNRFRERLRRFDTGKERQEFLAKHRNRMDERARALGYEIRETE